jgi:hypothetical protein
MFRIQISVRRRGRVVRRCGSDRIPFEVRNPPLHRRTAPAGPPTPRASYYGHSGLFAVVVRTIGTGRRILANWEYEAQCRAPRETFTAANVTPPTALGPGGRFRRAERYTIRFTDAIGSFRVVFQGRVGARRAAGVLHVEVAFRRRAGGQVIDRCRTGTVRWAAVL